MLSLLRGIIKKIRVSRSPLVPQPDRHFSTSPTPPSLRKPIAPNLYKSDTISSQ
ncbi:hypothetical protein [Stenomitos frigidus]|uniref:hypothetical protein n=1 Tax=Stenomitos frigidus TaxID=1886765 RepID=UPI0015E66A2C|nr:hypothetical protein [Stenomitos frigidus]